VAFVIGGLPFGGVENWLYDLCSRLETQAEDGPRIEAHVVNVSGTGLKAPEFERAGFRVSTCGADKSALKTSNLATLRRVRAELRRIRPHVVHTLQFSGDYFGRLGALGLGVPVVTHIRNMKSEKKPRRRLLNKLLSFVTTHYLAVSRAAAGTIEREHNIARRPVTVLYNAVEPAKLDVPPHDLVGLFPAVSGQPRMILGVGRLVEQKNFDKLLRAVALLRQEEPRACAAIVGEGPEHARLADLVEELGLTGAAHLEGYVENAEVPRWLRAAEVLAMPSDYEGLPVTHVEAMFCGLPAVISEFVPSIEIAAGCSLVSTTEPESIAEKLLDVLSNEARREAMRESALATAQDFTMEKYVRRLNDFYLSLGR
jgi:glycosyltransferase involved in cell wall biosynthesis